MILRSGKEVTIYWKSSLNIQDVFLLTIMIIGI